MDNDPNAAAQKPPDLSGRLRPGIDPRRCQVVITLAGASLLVSPLTIRPRDVLAGTASGLQLLAWEVRTEWARAELQGKPACHADGVMARLCIGAIQSIYDATVDEINDCFTNEDAKAMAEIANIACGYVTGDAADMRRRAFAAACLGLADCNLSAAELARAADFAWNAGRAPAPGG